MIPPFVGMTPWQWAPNQLVRVKRYFVFGAFPFAQRKHLTTAHVLGAYDLGHPGLSYESLDDKAVRELLSVMEGCKPTMVNTVRFREYDVLPTDFEPR